MKVDLPDVQPGDFALHISGELDPRPVAAVDHDRDMIQLNILGSVTPWLPMEAYTYARLEG